MLMVMAADPQGRGMIRARAIWNGALGHGILKVMYRLGGGMHHDPGMILDRRHRRAHRFQLLRVLHIVLIQMTLDHKRGNHLIKRCHHL